MRSMTAVALWAAALATISPSVATAADAYPPVVEKVTDVTGPLQGYRITTASYQAKLSCNHHYGFHSFEITKDGEKLASTRGMTILDAKTRKIVFSPFEFRKDKSEFVVTHERGAIVWKLDPSAVKTADYGGRLDYGPNRIALTQEWTLRVDVTARAQLMALQMGAPLFTGCPFSAVLADGTEAAGDIPVDLPEQRTTYAGGTAGKSIKEITFGTVKGKVMIAFSPDAHVPLARVGFPRLSTVLRKDCTPPRRQYDMPCYFPAGDKGQARRYTVTFEFPD